MLAQKYCNGEDPPLGAALAHAMHRYGVEVFESRRDPSLLLYTLSGLASNYANAANLLGRSDDVIRFADEWIPFYTARGETQNLPSLKTQRVAALLNRNRIDEAEAQLQDPTIRGNLAADIEIVRLERKLRELKETITAPKTPALTSVGALGGEEAQRAIERAVSQVVGSADAITSQVLQRLAAEPAMPADAAGYKELLEALRQGESLLTGGSTEDNQWTIKRRIREATGIFVGSTQPPSENLRASLATLETCLDWADAHNDVELTNDALWGIYLCHGRLDEPSLAADALLTLRANLEERRAGIANPLQRGGVFGDYPHLFDTLCEKLHMAGRVPELLKAIEAAKGRGIADILTNKAGRPVADADVYGAVRHIHEATVAHGFHYLTFHIDDGCTYAVLVTNAGRLISPPIIPLGRLTIRNAAVHADPRDWGNCEDGSEVRVADSSGILEPFVSWIAPLLADGTIQSGDHLCYSADEDLANVPLQYLKFMDGTLSDKVSVSKIYGAFHLDLLLKDEAPTPPNAFFGVVVPTEENLTSKMWPAMHAAMRRPLEWLANHLPGETVVDVHADVQNVRIWPLQNRVVHFSTHGVFPKTRFPFENSGIVLAYQGRLPNQGRVASGADLDTVFTPSKVVDWQIDLHGSHVSLMACVSGLSREGRGGDALGLEWALIQGGARSVLATHWNVSARLAAEFCERFYDHWLSERTSRAVAHARAMKDLQQSHGVDAVRAWAAFTLVGDWR